MAGEKISDGFKTAAALAREKRRDEWADFIAQFVAESAYGYALLVKQLAGCGLMAQADARSLIDELSAFSAKRFSGKTANFASAVAQLTRSPGEHPQ